jgi:phage gpG-like protein
MAKITVDQFSEKLENISKGEFLRTLHGLALKYAGKAETRAKGRAETLLTVRSGALTRSIAGRVQKQKGRMTIRLTAGGGGEDVKYAATHEYGAVIRPVRAKMLAIPVHKSLRTGRGVGKVPGPRDVPGMQFAISGKGQRMFIHAVTKEVYFILRQRVEIPARPFMAPSMKEVDKMMMPEVCKLLGQVT